MKNLIITFIIVLFASCASTNDLKYHKKLQKQHKWTPKSWKVHKSLRGHENSNSIIYSTAHI